MYRVGPGPRGRGADYVPTIVLAPFTTWSHIWRPAREAAGLPEGFGLRDLRHYYATVLIFGGENVKTVQLAMGHPTPTITLNTYVGYWPDAVSSTRSLVDAALGASRLAALRRGELCPCCARKPGKPLSTR